MKNFFISYNQADKKWAEWIAWTLEEAGYYVVIQEWDFRPGNNFVLEMNKALSNTQKIILVLSNNYLQAEYTQSEWASFFKNDPQGKYREVLPVKVQACDLSGILGSILYIDCVDIPEVIARQRLLDAVQKERGKPSSQPIYPGFVQSNIFQTHTQVKYPGKPWNVPYERNRYFTGRHQVISDIYNRLRDNNAAALSQSQAISGLGGIGKTQTVVEYAYRYRQEYQTVFWIRAESIQEIISSFLEISKLLNLLEKNERDPKKTINSVKDWMLRNKNWLLIFDNADTPSLIEEFLPKSSNGHILITSRAQIFDSIGILSPIALDKMQPSEAINFIFFRTGRNPRNSTENESARKLVSELDYLPLALEQASAYIVETQAQIQTYLISYRKRRLTLLEKSTPKTGKYPNTVATTWNLNFEQVEKESLAAAHILKVSSFYSPDAIPYEVLLCGANALGDIIASALDGKENDPMVIEELLTVLSRYSLIKREATQRTYGIYRIVQEVVKDSMDEENCKLWGERTVHSIYRAFPQPEYSNWSQCERLLGQSKVSIELINKYKIESLSAVDLLIRTGVYLRKVGRYSEAEPFYIKALSFQYYFLGEEDSSIATSLNGLALLYDNQGRYKEAEDLYQKALKMKIRIFGEQHPSVATSLNSLAGLYNKKGQYHKAEELYIKVLSMKYYLFGEEHKSITTSLNDIALLYDKQGRFDEAEKYYLKAIDFKKRIYGELHPSYAKSINNLASLYSNQERNLEANRLYLQAIKLQKKIYKTGHPSLANSLNNLASLYSKQARIEDAKVLYEEALIMYIKLLGDHHHLTIGTRKNLHIINKQLLIIDYENLREKGKQKFKNEQSYTTLKKIVSGVRALSFAFMKECCTLITSDWVTKRW